MSLTPRGRFRLNETVTFETYDKNPKHVYYRELEQRELPQKVWPGDTVTGDLKKDYRTSQRMAFQQIKPAAQTLTATISYEMERVWYAGDPGYWVLNFAIDSAKFATITIERLPSGATAWLTDASLGGKLVSKCEGSGGDCQLVVAKKVSKPRLIVQGLKPSDPYEPGIVTRFAEANVKATLSKNSTLNLNFLVNSAKHEWNMPILNTHDTFVGKTQGNQAAVFDRWVIGAYLVSEADSTTAQADLAIGTPYARDEGQYIEIAIGALDTPIRTGKIHASSEKSQYSEYHTIQLDLPSDKPVIAEVLRCKDNWSYASECGAEHELLSEFKQNGRQAELKLLEPVVQREIVVRIYLPSGYLNTTDTLTLLRYQVSHFWKYGYKPGWARIAYVLIWLALLVAALIIVVKLIGYVRRKARVAKEQKSLQTTESAALSKILKSDPQFDIEAFRTRGKEIASRIQKSWCAGDMRDCRRYLSQGVYNRFRLQLKIMRDLEKRKNIMADFEIRRFYVLAHNRSGEYDCLTVRMDAAARDLMAKAEMSDSDALKAAARAPLAPFTEFYSFMRKTGVQTEHPASIDACSHCGTPFEGEGELTKCRSCGAILGSGTFDWVLAEITQYSEYRGQTTRKDLGGLSSDRIEDRASFVFLRDLMAKLTGSTDYIVRDASATYLSTARETQTLYDIAVGAADLESLTNSGNEAIAKVRIKWSAAADERAVVRHRQSILTLRAANADISGAGFAEHSCSSCGAPLPESDSIECSYCHSPIQRKNADWLLESVETNVE